MHVLSHGCITEKWSTKRSLKWGSSSYGNPHHFTQGISDSHHCLVCSNSSGSYHRYQFQFLNYLVNLENHQNDCNNVTTKQQPFRTHWIGHILGQISLVCPHAASQHLETYEELCYTPFRALWQFCGGAIVVYKFAPHSISGTITSDIFWHQQWFSGGHNPWFWFRFASWKPLCTWLNPQMICQCSFSFLRFFVFNSFLSAYSRSDDVHGPIYSVAVLFSSLRLVIAR